MIRCEDSNFFKLIEFYLHSIFFFIFKGKKIYFRKIIILIFSKYSNKHILCSESFKIP